MNREESLEQYVINIVDCYRGKLLPLWLEWL